MGKLIVEWYDKTEKNVLLNAVRAAEWRNIMTRITKDTTIGEAIQYDAGIISILMGAGMHCVGCPSSAGETIEEAAMVHGLDCDALLEDIHDYLQSVG